MALNPYRNPNRITPSQLVTTIAIIQNTLLFLSILSFNVIDAIASKGKIHRKKTTNNRKGHSKIPGNATNCVMEKAWLIRNSKILFSLIYNLFLN